MWVVRESLRLLVRIAVAVAIATLIAEVRSLVSGGDFAQTWKITMLLLGALMLLLAGAGGRTTMASRVVNWGEITPGRGGTIMRGFFARTEGLQLTASAVFFASGLVMIALALVA
jgi:hypothetical protein